MKAMQCRLVLATILNLLFDLRGCDAYFDSVDGRTPPRWSSTSLISFPDCSGSFRRSFTINTNCFDGFQETRCLLSRLGV